MLLDNNYHIPYKETWPQLCWLIRLVDGKFVAKPMELPYLDYFQLTEEPFSTVPSPRYFFLTPVHATALEKTAYVVGAKKGTNILDTLTVLC